MNLLTNRSFVTCLIGFISATASMVHGGNHHIQHVNIYRETGRFGGWPANHGIWIWDNEILFGFSRGYYKDRGLSHHFDPDRPEEHVLARSTDGGAHWTLEHPNEKGMLLGYGPSLHGTPLPDVKIPDLVDLAKPINFAYPDLAFTVRMSDVNSGVSRFHVSYDRGHTWSPAYRLPLFGQPGIAARTDYIVNGARDCLLFLTAAKQDGTEGRPLCARTRDGGLTWNMISWIGEELKATGDFAIMPSTIRLGSHELFTSVRVHHGTKRWIDTYRSLDDGASWQYAERGAEDTGVGNPPSMILLNDGRICLTYGFRASPYGIRARISSDHGRTWGEEIILRDDGSGRDLGYPLSVQRPDGKVITVYYYQDQIDPYRHIAATIWKP